MAILPRFHSSRVESANSAARCEICAAQIDMQSMIFYAGASGVMIGDYLTTKGRQVQDDLQMLRDLDLQVRGDTFQRRAAQAAGEP